MESDYRDKQRKNYIVMRVVYDVAMGILILGIGALMFFGNRLNIYAVQQLDPVIKYIFGSLCVIYGGFRLYRGIKHQY
jgi:hypothetical protein